MPFAYSLHVPWPIGFPVINQLPDLPDDVSILFPACTVALLDHPVYDLLPAPEPSYLPPPVVLCNKHLLRTALETSSVSHRVQYATLEVILNAGCG